MAFADQIRKFALTMETDSRAAFVAAAGLTFESIVEGSSLTGAPGQPVATGQLHDSWILELPGDGTAVIASDAPYAIAVEEGLHGVAFKNHGPHSVALTVAAWERIVEKAALQVAGNNA